MFMGLVGGMGCYAGILLKKNEDLTAVKNAKNRVKNGFRW